MSASPESSSAPRELPADAAGRAPRPPLEGSLAATTAVPVFAPASIAAIIFVVGAVQFVNILDFMMVMPLGPDFAVALGIPTSHLGLIGGSYTAAGCIAGLVGLLFLDRFPRRSALVVAMAGLAIGTLAGGFATDLPTLIAARVVAGLFGGPATSIAVSIITDVVPPAKRGQAMGQVMGAFSAASVLGVPLGLELAARAGWRSPFFVVAGLGVIITVVARVALPVLDGHLRVAGGPAPRLTRARLRQLVTRREVVLAMLLVASVNFSSFLFIPNISALLQLNLGYPREHLGLLYLCGGACSFFTMRAAGRLVDRAGSTTLIAVGVLAFSAIVVVVGVVQHPATPVLAVFICFMIFQSTRNVASQTLTSKVPAADERAGFQSINSAIQHGAGACGAVLSSTLLDDTSGRLDGMPTVAAVAIGAALVSVPVARALEAGVRRLGAK